MREDDLLAAVMTDKATVEIPFSRAGKVIAINGEVGEKIAVGSELVRLEIEGGATEKPKNRNRRRLSRPRLLLQSRKRPFTGAGPLRPEGEKPLATPSVRLRARDAGIDLRRVRGTGPAGRITHEDLDRVFPDGSGAAPALSAMQPIHPSMKSRSSASGMQDCGAHGGSKRHIPHITIVEEVDVTTRRLPTASTA